MNTPFHLQDKNILITGASSGIGRQIAVTVARMGGNVFLVGRNEKRLQEACQNLNGSGHQYFICDILVEEQVNQLISKLPSLDGVVHSVGFVRPYPVKFLSTEKINETFGPNYFSQMLLMASLLRLKKIQIKASIVFISSIAASHPHKGGALYAGSKSALEAFSKVLALELYPQGVRSNCVAPAMVKTPMYEYSEQNASKETMDAHVEKYPLGVGMPEDVANAVVFLLSDASRWITGTTITLDGGFLLGGI